jgi:hypothetical protein
LEQAELVVRGAQPEQGQFTYGSLKAGQLCATESLQNQILKFEVNGQSIAIIAQAEGPLAAIRTG